MRGLRLCQRFYHEAVGPLLSARFPALRHSAALLGYGSDVLGFDDEVSRDHMWGPRLYLFLDEPDMPRAPEILRALSEGLPAEFCGFPVSFSPPDPNDNGVRHAVQAEAGKVDPLIWICAKAGFTRDYLGIGNPSELTFGDWLSIPEHRLLGFTSGQVFHDDPLIALTQSRAALRYFPDAVWRAQMIALWDQYGEEEAFAGRAAQTGDDIGMRLILARQTERLMRLCFVYARRYAPYSKWFGRAWRDLPPFIPEALLRETLCEPEPQARLRALNMAAALTVKAHNAHADLPRLTAQVRPYFGRSMQVLGASGFAEVLLRELPEEMQERARLGNLTVMTHTIGVYDDPRGRWIVR